LAKKWSDKKKKLLEDLLGAGWKVEQIAKHPDFQCSPANISQHIKKYGLTAARFQKIEDMKKAEEAKVTVLRDSIADVLMKKVKNGEMDKESPHYLGMLYKNLGDDRRKEKALDINDQDMSLISQLLKEGTEKERKKFIKRPNKVIDVTPKEDEE
jgi:hypothetical protein